MSPGPDANSEQEELEPNDGQPDETDDEVRVEDEASSDDSIIPERYDITSYGADPDVDGLVRRLRAGSVFIPTFQRDYVWKIQEASRFIESLLLGLPVPGVFFAVEEGTNRQLVIDGQQRLRTLLFFYDGYFNPREDDRTRRVFKLTKVQGRLEGKTYASLDEPDRLKLDAAVIHATIVKQDTPADDDTSIYHIFERLNNGGRRLTDQEIRTALYHGPLLDLVKDLNALPAWRSLFGKRHKRLKDQEMILRFLALSEDYTHYQKPMKEFINKFAQRHKRAGQNQRNQWTDRFRGTIELAKSALGGQAFRYGTSLNAAVFDSVMVGLHTRLTHGTPSFNRIREKYDDLLLDREFRTATTRATSDETSVSRRINAAIAAFADA